MPPLAPFARAGLAALFALLLPLACGTPEPPPHLVVVVVDTLRDDVVDAERAPALTALAAEGVRLTRSYTHAPMTLPAHTSLFSSRLPHETGVVVNGQEVPAELPLLAEHLAGQGYRCLGVGSMASLWDDEPGAGLERGFERFVRVERDYADGARTAAAVGELLADVGPDGPPLFLLVHLADPHEPYRDFAGLHPSLVLSVDGVEVERVDPRHGPHLRATLDLAAGPHELVLEDDHAAFVPRSLYLHADAGEGSRRLPLRWLEGQRLGILSRARVAFELAAPARVELESWVTDRPDQPEARRRYDAEVARADAAVGAVLADLRARELYDDALVLFTSDHGEAFGEHGWNGHSEHLYDELLRVPAIVKPPASATFDRARALLAERADELTRHVDLAPTLLDLAGLEPLPGAVGVSLLDPDRGAPVHFAETHRPDADEQQLSLTDGRWKLIHRPESGRFELYDLVGDPGELRDLFPRRGTDFAAWREALEARAASWDAGAERGLRADLEALGY